MGKTKYKQHDLDDDNRTRNTRQLRHARNIRGQGMRIINAAVAVDDSDFDDCDLDIYMTDHNETPANKKYFR